jgi:hypothetical protein
MTGVLGADDPGGVQDSASGTEESTASKIARTAGAWAQMSVSADKVGTVAAEWIAGSQNLRDCLLQESAGYVDSWMMIQQPLAAVVESRHLSTVCENNIGPYIPEDDARQIVISLRLLDKRLAFDRQVMCEQTMGLGPGTNTPLYTLCKTPIGISYGAWDAVESLPQWPMGLISIQHEVRG